MSFEVANKVRVYDESLLNQFNADEIIGYIVSIHETLGLLEVKFLKPNICTNRSHSQYTHAVITVHKDKCKKIVPKPFKIGERIKYHYHHLYPCKGTIIGIEIKFPNDPLHTYNVYTIKNDYGGEDVMSNCNFRHLKKKVKINK